MPSSTRLFALFLLVEQEERYPRRGAILELTAREVGNRQRVGLGLPGARNFWKDLMDQIHRDLQFVSFMKMFICR
jgi:hypothetical protein